MRIKDFSGGLLLRPNKDKTTSIYGTIYTDIDHERGSLIPIREPLPLPELELDSCDSLAVEGNEQIYKAVSTTTINPQLGWEKAPLDNTDSCNYQQAYSYIYTMYNPTTQTDSFSSNVIYGTSNSDTDITVYPKVDVELWDAGYTKINVWRRTIISSSDKADIVADYENNEVHYGLVIQEDVDRDIGFAELQDTTNAGMETGDYTDTPKIPYDSRVFTDMGGDTEASPETVWLKGHNQHAIVFVSDDDDCKKGSDIPYAISIDKAEGETYSCHIILTITARTAGKVYINDCGKYRLLQTLNAGDTKIDIPDYADYDDIMPIPCDRSEPLVIETLVDETVQGEYTSPSCDDLLTVPEDEQVFTYSNILNSFIYHSTEGYMVDFKGSMYVFDGETNYFIDANKPDSGLMTVGIAKPELEIVSGTEGEDIKYRVTFYNSVHDIESPASEPISLATAENIEATLKITNLDGVYADTIRVYRLNKGLISYTLERIIPFSDASSFDVGVSGSKLDSIAGEPVLIAVEETAPLANLKYVTATNSILLGAIEDKLYFSEVGRPTVWKREDYIDFDTDITGVGVIRSGIIVFTLTDTYIIVGSSPTTFAKYLITKEVGCIHDRTVQPYNGGLLFASFDGIYFTDGGSVINFTEKRLSRLRLDKGNIINATVTNNMYHIAFRGDSIFQLDDYYEPVFKPFILVLDYRFNKMFRIVDQKLMWLGTRNRDIVFENNISRNRELYILYPMHTPYKELHFKSEYMDSGEYSRLKHYNDFYISYQPPMHLKIILRNPMSAVPDKVIYNADLPSDRIQHNLSSLAHVDGYAIRVECKGRGKVHEITYRSKGRKK